MDRKLENCIISVNNVTKHFKNGEYVCEALKGVSFEIPKGQFVSIVGHSGSGKSTLMYVMAGLEKMTGGDVIVDGVSISRLKERELCAHRASKTGFVFQSYFLESEYSVYNNIAVPLAISKTALKERKSLIENAAQKAGIDHKLKVKVSKLSGGEKQRTAIARAIVNNPPIIFADEPCGNLDSTNGKAIMHLLRELTEQGTTVILVTHNMDDAMETDRVITLMDGTVISDETL